MTDEDISVMESSGYDPNSFKDVLMYLESQDRGEEASEILEPFRLKQLKREFEKAGMTKTDVELKESLGIMRDLNWKLDKESFKTMVESEKYSNDARESSSFGRNG